LKNPVTAPVPIATRTASGTPRVPTTSGSPLDSAFTVSAQATDVNAICEPALRSMPPLVITIVIPSAPMPTITVWVMIVRAFRAERKLSTLSGSK
jgi:hypothetical protein